MKSVLLILALVVIMGCIFLTQLKRAETNRASVVLQANEQRVIVFYKDDCPDCQSVFPFLYFHNLRANDLVFVNLNQATNKAYIETYGLTSVPTLVRGDQLYQGTDKNKIRQFLMNEEAVK